MRGIRSQESLLKKLNVYYLLKH